MEKFNIIMMVNSKNVKEKALWSLDNGLIQAEGVNSFFLRGYVKCLERNYDYNCNIRTVVVTPNSSKFEECSFTYFEKANGEESEITDPKIKDYLYSGKLDDGNLDYTTLFN